MNTEEKPDLLYGLKAIATHLGVTPRQAEHQVSRGEIPTFKVGGKICSSRSKLAEHFAEQMQRAGKA
jgi:hypothetical protein